MALDRFVNFEHGSQVPSAKNMRKLLKDYLGEAAKKIAWKRDRFYVDLHGASTFPGRRLKDIGLAVRSGAYAKQVLSPRRWIEVHLGDDNVDVITRHADEYTNGVAQRLAEIIARYWKGKLQVG